MRCRSSAILLFCGSLLAPLPAAAQRAPSLGADPAADPAAEPTPQPEPPVDRPGSRWRPQWERFDVASAVIVAVAEIAAFSVYVAQPVTTPRWTDTLPGDRELRDALRVTDQGARAVLIDASDAMFVAMMAWPVLVDSVLLAGLVRGDSDVALQTALIDVEVMAVAHMATWLTSRLSGRVRPEAEECALAGTCGDTGSGPVQSFVGGHSLMAYASAGLTCTHHLESPWIAGNRVAAVATCGGALAMATTISFFRLAVDRHWASDVAIGSLMGAAIGFGLPYLLHYGRPPQVRSPQGRSEPGRAARGDEITFFAIAPGVGGDPRGATIVGIF